jgi:thymidylate synthase (FAD)
MIEKKLIKVHTHGFISLEDLMGDDQAVVDAARISYGTGTKRTDNNQGLINYLLDNDHTSPFEQNEIKLCIRAPIFVARQMLRHRHANVNEYSARYSVMHDEVYIPEQFTIQSKTNKQMSSGLQEESLSHLNQTLMEDSWESNYDLYQSFIEQDVSREQARMVLPVNAYTTFYWKCDLWNVLHFCKLRTHPHAQKEIQDYAIVIENIIAEWCPMIYSAYLNYYKEAFKLSKQMVQMIKSKDYSKPIDMSAREYARFIKVFG